MREITESTHPWVYTSCNRRRETALCRLRIGHTLFSHGYLMTKDFQPLCDDCLVPLTVRHLLIECPSLMELRHRYFDSDNGNFRLNSILGQSVKEDNLFKFVEEAGFLNKIWFLLTCFNCVLLFWCLCFYNSVLSMFSVFRFNQSFYSVLIIVFVLAILDFWTFISRSFLSSFSFLFL